MSKKRDKQNDSGEEVLEFSNEKVTADENIKKLTKSKDKLETDLREARIKINTLEKEIKISETKLHKERQTLKTDAFKEQEELAARQIKTLEMSNEDLQRELDDVKKVKSEETVAREKLEEELQGKEEINKQLLEQISDVKSSLKQESERRIYEQDKASNTIKEIKERIDALLKIKNDNQNEITQYQRELKCLKDKEKVQVQLLSKLDADLKTVLFDALAEHIAAHMNNKQLEVEIIKCMKASEIQPDMPLLLVCVYIHGRSANVTQLLKSMHVSSKVAILIIHMKQSHALPEEASDRVLVKVTEKYPTLGGIYDMAFTPENGIYKCELNDLNIVSITNFIKRVGVRKRALLLD